MSRSVCLNNSPVVVFDRPLVRQLSFYGTTDRVGITRDDEERLRSQSVLTRTFLAHFITDSAWMII